MILREASITYKKTGSIDSIHLDSSEKIYKAAKIFLENFDPEKEHFCVIALDRKNKVKGISHVTTGSISACIADPVGVFKPLVLQSAAAFAVFHNHPSGDPAPSRADIQVTRQLREASKIMNIQFMDHIIVGEIEDDCQGIGFYSFDLAGLI